jgi:hypothetical protein
MNRKELIDIGWNINKEDTNVFVANKDQYELSYDESNTDLHILKRWLRGLDGPLFRETLFLGKCPDVETFKLVCKLLEI